MIDIKEKFGDAVYSARAWAQGLAWGTLALALCQAGAAYFSDPPDWNTFVAAMTAVVAVFLPQVPGPVAKGVIQTVLIRRGKLVVTQTEVAKNP